MKQYESPSIEILEFDTEDVITTTTETETPEG